MLYTYYNHLVLRSVILHVYIPHTHVSPALCLLISVYVAKCARVYTDLAFVGSRKRARASIRSPRATTHTHTHIRHQMHTMELWWDACWSCATQEHSRYAHIHAIIATISMTRIDDNDHWNKSGKKNRIVARVWWALAGRARTHQSVSMTCRNITIIYI